MESFSVTEYLDRHRVKEELEDAINELVKEKPRAPFVFLASLLLRKFAPTPTMEKLVAREVLDSQGNPTVQTDIFCKVGGNVELVAQGTAPSGSTTDEALELRDNEEDRYFGRGVSKAVANVNDQLSGALHGQNPCDQLTVDKLLCDADGTNQKARLGGNALTSVSFGVAVAGAKVLGIPLYSHFSKLFFGEKAPAASMPVPMVTILNGGKLKMQEFMVLTKRDISFQEALRQVTTVYHQLGKIVRGESNEVPAISFGCDGGYALQIETPDEALSLIERSISEAGFEVGDIKLAIGAAAQGFYSAETQQYEPQEGVALTSEQMVDYFSKLIDDHPHLVSIEDGMANKDHEGWARLTERLGDKVLIVGGGLFATNARMLAQGIEEKWANAVSLKVNQIGTISEAQDAARMTFAAGHQVIVSHRSGESTSSLIADLAVGIGAGYIKTGAPTGERIAKYNRLLQIEEMLMNQL